MATLTIIVACIVQFSAVAVYMCMVDS